MEGGRRPGRSVHLLGRHPEPDRRRRAGATVSVRVERQLLGGQPQRDLPWYQFSQRTWDNTARTFKPDHVGVDPAVVGAEIQDLMAWALGLLGILACSAGPGPTDRHHLAPTPGVAVREPRQLRSSEGGG